jgi:hypothetical protein
MVTTFAAALDVGAIATAVPTASAKAATTEIKRCFFI